jgi:hypothetical protein
MAQSRAREWRHDDRGPAWRAPRGLERDVPRLSSRSRWQQTVRASSHAGCLNYRRSNLSRTVLSGRSSRARERWLGPIGRAPYELTFGISRGSALAGPVTTGVRCRASAVLEPIAEPNHAALQHLGARQGHRGDRRRYAGIPVTRIEDARRALRAVDGGADRKADLVDQAGP